MNVVDAPCGDMTWMSVFLKEHRDVEYTGNLCRSLPILLLKGVGGFLHKSGFFSNIESQNFEAQLFEKKNFKWFNEAVSQGVLDFFISRNKPLIKRLKLVRLLRVPCATAPKIWIWTSKIMPDLWLSAVFCQIKKKSLHPTVRPLYCVYCTVRY